VLYGKSSRADHLRFVRFLFVPLICYFFCIYIYENYVKMLHFLRPTHIQRHAARRYKLFVSIVVQNFVGIDAAVSVIRNFQYSCILLKNAY